ncbi:unnamed protein product [Caenorhabditis brenneri]
MTLLLELLKAAPVIPQVPPPALLPMKKCNVCQADIDPSHSTCKVCMKFYVENILKPLDGYKCIKNDKSCKIEKNTRDQCKFCWLKKCRELISKDSDKTVRRTVRTNRSTHKVEMVCEICKRVVGWRYSGGSHFTVQCCACSNFFERNSRSKLPPCQKNCEVLCCKSCRLRKCLEKGMKVSRRHVPDNDNGMVSAVDVEKQPSHSDRSASEEAEPSTPKVPSNGMVNLSISSHPESSANREVGYGTISNDDIVDPYVASGHFNDAGETSSLTRPASTSGKTPFNVSRNPDALGGEKIDYDVMSNHDDIPVPSAAPEPSDESGVMETATTSTFGKCHVCKMIIDPISLMCNVCKQFATNNQQVNLDDFECVTGKKTCRIIPRTREDCKFCWLGKCRELPVKYITKNINGHCRICLVTTPTNWWACQHCWDFFSENSSGRNDSYQCSNVDKSCPVLGIHRDNCKFCWLQKCHDFFLKKMSAPSQTLKMDVCVICDHKGYHLNYDGKQPACKTCVNWFNERYGRKARTCLVKNKLQKCLDNGMRTRNQTHSSTSLSQSANQNESVIPIHDDVDHQMASGINSKVPAPPTNIPDLSIDDEMMEDDVIPERSSHLVDDISDPIPMEMSFEDAVLDHEHHETNVEEMAWSAPSDAPGPPEPFHSIEDLLQEYRQFCKYHNFQEKKKSLKIEVFKYKVSPSPSANFKRLVNFYFKVFMQNIENISLFFASVLNLRIRASDALVKRNIFSLHLLWCLPGYSEDGFSFPDGTKLGKNELELVLSRRYSNLTMDLVEFFQKLRMSEEQRMLLILHIVSQSDSLNMVLEASYEKLLVFKREDLEKIKQKLNRYNKTLEDLSKQYREGTATHPAVIFNIFMSIIGVITTVFHLLILSRKSMLKSSVISIMIGMASCDFIAMFVSVVSNILYLMIQNKNEKVKDFCSLPLTTLPFHFYWFGVVIYDLFRRSSTWLSVLLAFIRWLIIKFGTRRKFRKVTMVPFGFYVVFASCLISFPLSGLYYFRYDIVQVGWWRAGGNCTEELPNGDIRVYNLVQSKLYTENDGVVGKMFQLVNGIVSKLIPCLLLPILSAFLIIELREARKKQQSIRMSIINDQSTPATTERTTGLVAFMTISSFTIELPGGIVRVLQVFYADAGYWRMATSVNQIVNTLFSINAAFHGFIFFLMSSQYQKTLAMVFQRKHPRIVVAHSSLHLT